jgi:hypothetical protein
VILKSQQSECTAWAAVILKSQQSEYTAWVAVILKSQQSECTAWITVTYITAEWVHKLNNSDSWITAGKGLVNLVWHGKHMDGLVKKDQK